MSETSRFTSRDLEQFPDPTDGTRYELIDGKLLITKLPRLEQIDKPGEKLHDAPELICEILSPDKEQERRDRTLKLPFYSHIGVEEYWIAGWQSCAGEGYRRDTNGLRLVSILSHDDALTSPLLPGFAQPLRELRDSEA